jgi:hypothetical protein
LRSTPHLDGVPGRGSSHLRSRIFTPLVLNGDSPVSNTGAQGNDCAPSARPCRRSPRGSRGGTLGKRVLSARGVQARRKALRTPHMMRRGTRGFKRAPVSPPICCSLGRNRSNVSAHLG